MTYTPSLDSLKSHPVPQWYADGKFGIFIHWGLFSVPGYASGTERISETFARHYWSAIARTPYTEWYWNAIKVRGTPSAAYHRAFWHDMPYEGFRDYFNDGLKAWNPDDWAERFAAAGARYVVLVTKHHDGYCLWPSAVEHPHRDGWSSRRDIVGELATAVRAKGLNFGVYYSGGIDWSFEGRPLRTLGDFVGAVPGGDYPAYADAQVRELISRYRPSIVWNDISWPDRLEPMLALFADYYNSIEDGVLNDRWMPATKASRRMKRRWVRLLFDLAAWATVKLKGAPDGVTPPMPPHCDFRTPEYTAFKSIVEKKWESTRGMSHSFGFNRLDTDKSYDPVDRLIADFVDTVSKNGNLLLNVGPRGLDAQIPQEQIARLDAFGAWLRSNGEGIYGSRPWAAAEGTAEAETASIPVRFTRQPDGALYAFLLGQPEAGRRYRLTARDAPLPPLGQVVHLASGATVTFTQDGAGLHLTAPETLEPPHIHGFRLEPAG